jgi:hypothetical protein
VDNLITRDLGEVMRDEMRIKGKIVSQLREAPGTIPELADSLGYPKHEVVLWVMAMWRYGIVEETGKPNDEGYYQYRLKE